MAITPNTIASRSDVLSAEESAQVDQWEAHIDRYLELNYAPGTPIDWGRVIKFSDAQARELVRRFRAAGWKVEAHNFDDGQLVLIFAIAEDLLEHPSLTLEADGTQ